MKIYTKVSFVFVLIIVVFLSALLLVNLVTQNEIKVLESTRNTDRENFIKNILDLTGTLLDIFVFDYTYWDDMVQFVDTADLTWAAQNIDEGQTTYKTNIAQIYRLDQSLVYATATPEINFSDPLPLPNEFFDELEKNRFAHFFMIISSQLLEIRAATVHPTSDPKRLTPPRGFYIVGKLWTDAELENLELLTSSKVQIKFSDQKNGDLQVIQNVLQIPLLSWDGKIIANVLFSSHSQLLDSLRNESKRYFIIIVIFASVLLLGATIMVQQWVSSPLSKIEKSLNEQDASAIRVLREDKSEFGKISRLIEGFFQQKTDLVNQLEEIKNLRDTLVQSEKMAMAGQLAFGVAHEVKNPLAVLLQGIDYLKIQRESSDPAIHQLFDDMTCAIERADNVVRDLLELGRPSDFSPMAENLEPLIDRALLLLKRQLDTDQIHVIKNFKVGIPKVFIDWGKMLGVFVNLLSNAAEAMPPGGSITITATSEKLKEVGSNVGHRKDDTFKVGKEAVIIKIEDTGSGIPDDVLPHIFDPFFTTKRGKGGTGLGLSVVRNIMQIHHGTIEITNRKEGGARATVMLPVS